MTQQSRIEAAIVAALLLAAAIAGDWRVRRFVARGGHPFFYQTYFEPAVMLACGRGFVVSRTQPPALTAFLSERRDSFRCDELGRDLPVGTDGLVQRPWRYLLTAVAAVWLITGISWSALASLAGILFAATIGCAYALCRQFAGRAASAVAAAALAVSPLHLANLPNLRDYAKAPFVVALAAMLAALVVRPRRAPALALLTLAYGIVMGVGYGFRTDLLIAFPPLAIAVLFFLPPGSPRAVARVAALVAFAAGFAVAGAPILSSVVSRGGCQWHFALLGLTTPFDRALGVGGGAYSWGHLYKDEYVWATVSAYATRMRPDLGYIEYCSHEYDVASGDYVRQILGTFPADILTRAMAASMRVLDLPYRHVVDVPLVGTAVVAVVIAATATANTRLAAFLVFAVLYFGGQTAVQFLPRHYFPFEFIGIVAAVTFVDAALRRRVRLDPPALKRAAIFVASVAALILIPLAALRAYQTARVRALLDQYAHGQQVPLALHHAGNGRYPLAAPFDAPAESEVAAVSALGRTHDRVVEIDIDPSRCAPSTTIAFDYDRRFPVADLSYDVPLEAGGGGATRLFEPVYAGFTGVTLSDPSPSCAPRATVVTGLDGAALHLPARLTPDWQSRSQFQRIQLLR